MKKIIILTALASIITGCVSGKTYNASQQTVVDLTTKNNTLENKVKLLEQQIKTNKTKRIIKLPTGAPTTYDKRLNNNNISTEDKAYFTAVNQYKAGDSATAVNSFVKFNKKFPNSKHHTKSLYNLGQAAYSDRNYDQAKLSLEELIYQNPTASNKASAVLLLKKVYKATGDNAKLKELNTFSKNATTETETY